MADNMKNNLKGGIDNAANQAKTGIDTAADKVKNLTDRGADAANRNFGNQGNQNQPQGTMDTVRDTAQAVADRASDYAGQAREKLTDWAGQARDAVGGLGGNASEVARNAQRWAGEAYDVAADNMGDFGREVTSLVRKHPIPAILIGFGVGLLVGRAARMV